MNHFTLKQEKKQGKFLAKGAIYRIWRKLQKMVLIPALFS